MLTKRIIPCLDVDAGRVVKGVSFVNLHDAGDPVELAAFYDREGADELVFLDITASSDGRDTILEVVKHVSEQVFIPLTVGGGVRSSADVRKLLQAGADKVAMNTAAVLDPSELDRCAQDFGSQCMVIAIDARHVAPGSATAPADLLPEGHPGKQALAVDADTRWEVYIHGGRTPTAIDAVKWAAYAAELGAGEVLLTSMDTDGHLEGFDLALTLAVSDAVSIPVIASGGAGTPAHFCDAVTKGHADAMLAATIFHYGEVSIEETKAHLADQHIPVRPVRD
jgi:cyclase